MDRSRWLPRIPPAWASAPAHALGALPARHLSRTIPLAAGVLSAVLYAWWGPMDDSVSTAAHAFFVPVVGALVFLASAMLVLLACLSATWIHVRFGMAVWEEADIKVRLAARNALRLSPLAREHARMWLARDPEGEMRAHHARRLASIQWSDTLAGKAATNAPTIAPEELERAERLRRRAAHLSKVLPSASAPAKPRARL